MRRWLACLWLALALPAAAGTANVTVEVYPPDCEARYQAGDGARIENIAPSQVFKPRESPLLVTWDGNKSPTVTLNLSRPHFRSSSGKLDLEQLNGKAPPADGVFRLRLPAMEADGTLWAIYFWIYFHPGPAALAGGGVGALLFFFGRIWWVGRQKDSKIAALEAYRQRGRELGDSMVENQVQLGRYMIVDRLGTGGMATVYKGIPVDTQDPNQCVALKVIRSEFAADEEFQRRFQREMRVYRDLSHPGIVRLEDYGTDPDYLAMEFIDGKPLADLLSPRGMELGQVLKYFVPVLEAVGYAHSKGVVHRDLKPENVMVTASGHVKVMDFGLARSQGMSQMTETGSVLGTAAYIPPEQVSEGHFDSRSDQYSLGVMLYQMLAGRTPFVSDEPLALVMKHLTEKPPPLRELAPQVAPGVEAVVMRMLAKSPRDRFASLADVARALEGEAF